MAETNTPAGSRARYHPTFLYSMKLRKLPRRTRPNDHLPGITPIYKVSLSGKPKLIGTGFWVTDQGHLITNWHVIEDNIGKDGIDTGPIYAMCMMPDRTHDARVLRQSHKHEKYDLALGSTAGHGDDGGPVSWPLLMTTDEPEVGDEIFTHAFVSQSQRFLDGKYNGRTTSKFHASLAIPDLSLVFNFSFRARMESGYVRTIFPETRDSVVLPFPCFQSEMPVYGANSGGPVFDRKGRICGINCTSYEGTDISFHIPLKGVLDLWATEIELIPEDPVSRERTLLELGLAKRARFDPPLAKVYFTFWERTILALWHAYLNLRRWACR